MNVFQLIDDDWWSICSPMSKQSQYMSKQVDYCPERMQQHCCLLRNVISGFKVFIEVSRFNQSFMNFRMCVFLAFLLVWLICQDLKYVCIVFTKMWLKIWLLQTTFWARSQFKFFSEIFAQILYSWENASVWSVLILDIDSMQDICTIVLAQSWSKRFFFNSLVSIPL